MELFLLVNAPGALLALLVLPLLRVYRPQVQSFSSIIMACFLLNLVIWVVVDALSIPPYGTFDIGLLGALITMLTTPIAGLCGLLYQRIERLIARWI